MKTCVFSVNIDDIKHVLKIIMPNVMVYDAYLLSGLPIEIQTATQRAIHRTNKNYQEADRLKEVLAEKYKIQDLKEGSIYFDKNCYFSMQTKKEAIEYLKKKG